MINPKIALSYRFLEMAKKNEDITALKRELYYIIPRKLENSLITDDLKKEFWVAIYNAFLLIMTRESQNGKIDCKKKRIKVAHTLLSLDDIKYGILRIPKYPIRLLNLHTRFYSIIIKQMEVEKPDKSLSSQLYKNHLKEQTKP
jgi:hypothetical protein